ncbi:LtfC-like domain-containing protein [Nocardia thailandica]|uniref:LtfC-like domain-containing protein n=1 Tax=Nocardia thailandica TaxID=257275 RepID=UPI0002DF0DD8|nr:hypothetical protein [Nocardia thailandica]
MLGNEPLIETIVLVPGQDFVHQIVVPEGNFIPVGTTCTLRIYDHTDTVLAEWSATVTTAWVSWLIQSEVSDTITIPAKFRIYVHFSDGKDFCWYRGQVARQD